MAKQQPRSERKRPKLRATVLLPALALLVAGCDGQPDNKQQLGNQPSGTPAIIAQPSLKIATWNLEHLAERNGRGCRPRTDADYAALRATVDALDADVIAFQEVENRRAAERVFAPDRYRVVISTRPMSGRGGGCYGLRHASIREQRVGFAIRKGVPFTRHPDVSELGLGSPSLRWGVDVTIALPEPLRLLAVHLKSGCNSGRAPSDRDCTVLFRQLPVLERWIDARAREAAAFAVLGDVNRRLASRRDAFWAEIDDAEPPAADLTLAAGQRRATCKARYREFIDHIILDTRAAARLVNGSFVEFTYGVPEDEHPSDHCPIMVALRSH